MSHSHTLTGRLQKGVIVLFLLGMFVVRTNAGLGLPPIILVQPLGLSVQNGGTATFTVGLAVSLTPLSYQWRYNEVDIPGATGLIYTKTNIQYTDGGRYSVKISNGGGTAISSDALLVVLESTITNVVDTTINVLSSELTTNGFRLRLSGPKGSNIVISASSDLSSWMPISTNMAADGTVDFTDRQAANFTSRFYRVRAK